MVGWHHQLDGHEFEQAPGIGDGQGSLVCCSPWGCKELDTTERLNWTELSEVLGKLNFKNLMQWKLLCETVSVRETTEALAIPHSIFAHSWRCPLWTDTSTRIQCLVSSVFGQTGERGEASRATLKAERKGGASCISWSWDLARYVSEWHRQKMKFRRPSQNPYHWPEYGVHSVIWSLPAFVVLFLPSYRHWLYFLVSFQL